MANKTIAIIDLDDWHNQYSLSLLFSSILEKKFNHLTLIDTNNFLDRILPFELPKTKKALLNTKFKLFDNTNLQLLNSSIIENNKILEYLKNLKKKEECIIINCDIKKMANNQIYFDSSDEIVIFCKFNLNPTNKLLSFFISNKFNKQKLHIIFYNYLNNLQDKKQYLFLLNSLKKINVSISAIKTLPKFNTLQEINNIDPWLEIYQKINNEF